MGIRSSEFQLLGYEVTVELSWLENPVERASSRIKYQSCSFAFSVLYCRALSWHELCQKRRLKMDG